MENQIAFSDSNETAQREINNQLPTNQQAVVENRVAPAQVQYAGFWVRYLAALIDGFILIIPNLVAVGVFFVFKSSFLGSVSGYIILWSYHIVMTKKYGATFGKKALGLQVISNKSAELSWGQLILRETIGKFISAVILCIGYFMAGFTEKKQALHDKIADTVVVYNDPNKKTPVWVIVVAAILPAIAILGIFSSIVLVSLNSARNKANDAAAKAEILSIIPDALLYSDSQGTLVGYNPTTKLVGLGVCSGKPIVNISPDGGNMAIFVKSCVNSGKYFCGDLNAADIVEVDGNYAVSGKPDCGEGGVLKDKKPANNNGPTNTTKGVMSSPTSVFTDSNSGMSINYFSDWKQEAPEKDLATFSLLSGDSLLATVSIQKLYTMTPDQLMSQFKANIPKTTGTVSDEKVFTYTMQDGTVLSGQQAKFELPQTGQQTGINLRKWLVVVPYKNNLYVWLYMVAANNFDTFKPDAIAMLDTWKIAQ